MSLVCPLYDIGSRKTLDISSTFGNLDARSRAISLGRKLSMTICEMVMRYDNVHEEYLGSVSLRPCSALLIILPWQEIQRDQSID
jgi:hypothetical protein